ncbi:hypothetical protein ACIRPS_30935 [Streptomyces griseoviridis]
MQQVDPALTAALRAGERTPAHTVRLGGVEVGPQVSAWTVDRAYATDLPDAMRAFSGSASAQLDVDLGGRAGVSAPALYGPWAPRSTADLARPGQSAVMGWGLAEGTAPAFRGKVRHRAAQSATDTVKLSALDGAERLRMSAVLPRPSGGLDGNTPYGSASNWVASPQWVVDHLLRNAGLHSAPPVRSGSLLYVSMHGGAAANVGYLKSLSGDWSRWTKTNAPWECAVQGTTAGTTKATYAPALRPVNRGHTNGLWYELFIDTTGLPTSGDRSIDLTLEWVANGASSVYANLRADFATGQVIAACGANTDPAKNSSLTWTVPTMQTARGTFHLAYWLTTSSSGVPTFEGVMQYPGSGGIILTPSTPPGATVGPATLGGISLRLGALRVESLQVSQLTAKPTTVPDITQNGQWNKTATLDVPDIPLRVIPPVSGSVWDVITQIARATLATAEFDAAGVFRWRNRSRWDTAPTTASVTVTSERELASLTITEEIDACRNYCQVNWQDWSKVKADTLASKQAINVISIAPGATASIVWTIGDEELDTAPPNTYTDVLPDCIRFVNANTDSAAVVYGAVEVGTTRGDGTLTLSMRNRSASTVWLRGKTTSGLSLSMITPSTTPGVSPSAHYNAAWNTASQAAYGVQSYTHDPGGWVQDDVSAVSLATALRTAGAWPCPLLGNVDVLADPRVQLGDVVRVRDTTGATLDTLAWVIGIRTTGGPEGVRQTLTLRGAAFNGVPTDSGLTPDSPVDPPLL